jgi:hypothetical protein
MRRGWFAKGEYYDCDRLIGYVWRSGWIWKPWTAIKREPRYIKREFWTEERAKRFVDRGHP